MRQFLVLILLFVGQTSLAESPFGGLESVQYKMVGTMDQTPGDEALVTALTKLGLREVTSLAKNGAQGYHVAHVMASPDLEKWMIIRYDFEVLDPQLKGKVLAISSQSYLFNSTDQSHRPVAVYFTGFTQKEITPLIIQINQSASKPQTSSPSHQSYYWLKMFLEPAQAAETETKPACKTTFAERYSNLKKVGAAVLGGVRQCSSKFWNGIENAMFGDFRDMFTGKVFSQMQEFYNVSKEIYHNISSNISTMYAGLEKAPEILMKLVCEVLGSAVGDAILVALTGGALAALKGAQTAARVAKIMEVIMNTLGNAKTKIVDTFRKVEKGFKRVEESAEYGKKGTDVVKKAADAAGELKDCHCSVILEPVINAMPAISTNPSNSMMGGIQ